MACQLGGRIDCDDASDKLPGWAGVSIRGGDKMLLDVGDAGDALLGVVESQGARGRDYQIFGFSVIAGAEGRILGKEG